MSYTHAPVQKSEGPRFAIDLEDEAGILDAQPALGLSNIRRRERLRPPDDARSRLVFIRIDFQERPAPDPRADGADDQADFPAANGPKLQLDTFINFFPLGKADDPIEIGGRPIRKVHHVYEDSFNRLIPISFLTVGVQPHLLEMRWAACSAGLINLTSWRTRPVARLLSSGVRCRYARRAISPAKASCRR